MYIWFKLKVSYVLLVLIESDTFVVSNHCKRLCVVGSYQKRNFWCKFLLKPSHLLLIPMESIKSVVGSH